MAQSSQFLTIWSDAKKRYAEVTGEDLDSAAFPHPSSIDELQNSLDGQNNKFGDFRKHRGTLFSVLNGACKPIELVANIAAGGAEMVFPPGILCLGAVVYLINAAKGVSASYDAITDLMRTLKDFLVRLTVYERETLPVELQEKFAEILATLLEVFGRSTKVVRRGFGGRLISMGKNILLGNDEKLVGLLDRLDTLTVTENLLVGAETLTEAKRTGRRVDDISATVTKTNTALGRGNVMIGEVAVSVQHLSLQQDYLCNEVPSFRKEFGNFVAAFNEAKAEEKEAKDKKHIDKAKALLSPSVSLVDVYSKIDKTRVPGTGDWIRQEALFQSWRNRGNPLLFVSGIPGSGKTYLSGNIISFLQEQYPQGVQHASHTSIGYFFFKDNHPSTRSFKQALNDLAYQISLNDPIYAKYIDSNIQSASDIPTIERKWERLFLDYFIKNEKVDSKVYLVLDGLDEALQSERQIFLELLLDLKRSTLTASRGSRINLVMVGRPEIIDEIDQAVEGTIPTIHVDWHKNSGDIVDYVRASIKKSKALMATKRDLQEEIVATLAQKAKGMFIWVDLMMRELSKKSRSSSIRESMQHAPKGLQKMLRHVLEGFSSSLTDEDPEDLNLILMWVTYAARPLALGELETILKLKSPEGDDLLLLEGRLRQRFASFFTLTREDGLSTADLQAQKANPGSNGELHSTNSEEELDDNDFDSNSDTTTIAFCHASLGDFFRDENEGKARAGPEDYEIGVDSIEAKVHLLTTCLNLLCDPYLSNKIEGSSSMLPYAQRNWLLHVEEVLPVLDNIESAKKKEVGNLLLKILRDETVIPIWAVDCDWSFFTLDSLNPIRAFLEHMAVLDELSVEDRLWVESNKMVPSEFYIPTARALATQWLQDWIWPPIWCIRSMYTILKTIHNRVDDDISNPAEAIPISVILNAAEWPGFEETALWHRRLAASLRDYEYYDEAMMHFRTALDMDPGMWLARSGIAKTHAAQGKYGEAIELEKLNDSIVEDLLARETQLNEDVESCHISDRATINTDIGNYYRELLDMDNALEHYKLAFTFDNQAYALQLDCIQLLTFQYEKDGSGEIISLLKAMDEEIPGCNWTRLTAMIWSYFWWDESFFEDCKSAAEKVEELPMLIAVYENATAAARKNRHPILAIALDICLSELYQAADLEEEQVVRIWERVLKLATTPGAMDNWQIGYCKNYVATKYGPYCLARAREFRHSTQEESEWVETLESLCKAKEKATDDAPKVMTTNHCAIYLGRWYHETDCHEEAKSCFQPFIKQSLMMLSDDDPENDRGALWSLARALMASGDDESALAVLHSLSPDQWPDAGEADSHDRQAYDDDEEADYDDGEADVGDAEADYGDGDPDHDDREAGYDDTEVENNGGEAQHNSGEAQNDDGEDNYGDGEDDYGDGEDDYGDGEDDCGNGRDDYDDNNENEIMIHSQAEDAHTAEEKVEFDDTGSGRGDSKDDDTINKGDVGGADENDADWNVADESDADGKGADESGADRSGADERSEDESGANENDADWDVANENDTDENDADESGADGASAGSDIIFATYSNYMKRMNKKYPDRLYVTAWFCGGHCCRSFFVYAEMSLCRICEFKVCDRCLKLDTIGHRRLKEDRNRCSPDHVWLHVDIPEHEVEEGQILLGSEVISFEDFKERLRLKWEV